MTKTTSLLATLLTAATLAGLTACAEASAGEGPEVVVYKSPTCGCCEDWIEHMEANGFRVRAVDTNDVYAHKQAGGVPGPLGSCHTAFVDGYAIEGHVPADLVKKLLEERPAGVAGLAVPGMPIGSPGMEMPGYAAERYDVIAFDSTGGGHVYASR